MTGKVHSRGRMTSSQPCHARQLERGPEQGYALLMVIFLVALVIVGMAAAIPDVLTQGRREKEAEMIFRGNQYDRGIKLYYKKMGKYPQSLDDIVKEQNGIHFMRQAYKDPMNKEDGSWRLIYVTSSGQLINSLLYTSLQDMVAKLRPNSGISFGAPPGGTPVGGLQAPGSSKLGSGFGSGVSSGFGGSDFGGSGGFGNSPQQGSPQSGGQGNPAGPTGSNQSGTGQGGPGQTGTTNQTYQSGGDQGGQYGQTGGQSNVPGQPGVPGQFGGPGNGAPGNGTPGQQPSSAGTDVSDSDTTGQVFGGNLTGVASKVDKPSLKIYQTGKTYKKWEFIWNPQIDAANAAPGGGGAAPQGLNGTPGGPGGVTTPFGGAPGQSGAPSPTPPSPAPGGLGSGPGG